MGTTSAANKKPSRSKKLIINSVSGAILFAVNLVTTFIAHKVFVDALGFEVSGLAEVLSSVISALSIVDLGIGTAITFSLYKPLAENDTKKLALLISFFRKIYLIIGGIIFGLGLAVIPILPALTKYAFTLEYLVPVYMLFLVKASVSYFFTYNFTILRADQKSYIISIFDSIVKLIVMGTQIFILLTLKDYLPYLVVSLAGSMLMDIILFSYVKKKYPYLSSAKGERLPEEDTKVIKTKVFSMIFHRIGRYLVNSSDTLIMSIILAPLIVGYYKSYLVITATITSLIINVFSGVLAAFGNIIATEDKGVIKKSFKNIRFLYFFLCTILVAGVFVLAENFLRLWLGDITILPKEFLVVFCLNIFLSVYGEALVNLRNAAGIYEPDRYLPILLIFINIALSVPLAYLFGVTGILLGTTVCYIIRECIALPYIAKKYIYGGTMREYYGRFALDFGVMLACVAACYGIVTALALPLSVGTFIASGFICVFVSAAILFAVYARSAEMKYFFSFFKRLLRIGGKKKEDLPPAAPHDAPAASDLPPAPSAADDMSDPAAHEELPPE